MLRRLLLALTLLALPAVARAQGWIEIERPPRPVPSPPNVQRVSSDVRIRVDGRVATVEVEEQFRNVGGWLAEGSYLYPMPGEAVFQNFSLWMGDQEIRGEIMNADQARGIYEEIVRRQRDPALLTLEGHGLIRARVFPIQPGQMRKVVLRYTQLLSRDGDALRLKYALGQRGAIGSAGAQSLRVTAVNADQWGTPYSPTHQITSRRGDGNLVISLDSTTAAGGDVDLFLPLRRGLVGTSLTTYAPGGEDGYFMLLLSPAAADDGQALPRDVTFVIDISGSMSGVKIEQARAALRQALGTLRPADRFRLISFSSAVTNFRDGFVPATRANLDSARDFVNGLIADGGTNIAGALDAALGQGTPDARLPIVVFITDGIPSVGEQSPERIAEAAGAHLGRTRIFTFGIGQDVNTFLLDRLAQEGRGTAQYLPPGADVEVAVSSLVQKIQHPALTNLRIAEHPVELVDTYPSRLPDLFFGEELVIFGRYHGTGSGDVVVTGERNGHVERFAVRADFPATSSANAYIPRLWAARRIGELTRQIRLEGASESLVSAVRDLGTRYGIITEYTSYLVQEPGQVALQRPILMRNQAAMAPAPAMQSGSAAVGAARASADLMGAGSLAAADHLAEARLDELKAGSGGRAAVRRVGGRVFVNRDHVWTDAAHQDSLRIVDVAPFSDAYFALVRALPELAPWLALANASDDVLIAGRRASIRIRATGTTAWSGSQLDRLVRDWR